VKAAPVKPAPVKPAKAAAMESTAAVETPASAVRRGLGDFWLKECAGEQHDSCDTGQGSSDRGPGSILG